MPQHVCASIEHSMGADDDPDECFWCNKTLQVKSTRALPAPEPVGLATTSDLASLP